MKKVLIAFLSIISLSFLSCKKEADLYQLTVLVSTESSVVNDASVHLYEATTGGTSIFRRTDENGEVRFIFEQATHAEIEITKGSARSCTSEIISKGHKTIYIELKPFSQQATNGC
ncbi:hypothetical protein Oweho_2350 [Owenweeksia hongkongensis DSM 17368]|uniref:Lipoprotein n=1 Tax=Owenweeksia hongkongensis (strain DSM 17368 / CIP 108786 / JCM 12287 / NRRL B-23963 / UST20020801) TaxID=926562 RepID=G8R6A1_OWEHD|nr:hypothetical protein [Owenweeksia hongkongensis]AEV33321.1 hypothetical protein Oweho_2350 [Owenweeksia hongkongensis DSM 17368]